MPALPQRFEFAQDNAIAKAAGGEGMPRQQPSHLFLHGKQGSLFPLPLIQCADLQIVSSVSALKRLPGTLGFTTSARKGRAQSRRRARLSRRSGISDPNRLATRIAAMLPPHAAWVEAFCGSAAVTLSKPPTKIEVIDDLDDQIVNLFKQLRGPNKHVRSVHCIQRARCR
jgi:hypothetical protein